MSAIVCVAWLKMSLPFPTSFLIPVKVAIRFSPDWVEEGGIVKKNDFIWLNQAVCERLCCLWCHRLSCCVASEDTGRDSKRR